MAEDLPAKEVPTKLTPSERRKLGAWATCIILVLAYLTSAIIVATNKEDAGELDGQMGTIPAVQYDRANLGLASAPMPVVLEYPATKIHLPVIRLLRSYQDNSTRKWCEFEVMGSTYLEKVAIPYYNVTWVTAPAGAAPTAELTLQGNVWVWFTAKGYNIWRFLTYQGSPTLSYNLADQYKAVGGGDALQRLDAFMNNNVADIRISIPDGPEWQAKRTIAVG